MAREYKQRTGGADRLSFSIHKPEDFRALGMQVMAVSYTHLDVYKRQVQKAIKKEVNQAAGLDFSSILFNGVENIIGSNRAEDVYKRQILRCSFLRR